MIRPNPQEASLTLSDDVKVVVFVPLSHAGLVREAVEQAGGGTIGNYRGCSFSLEGLARFTPDASATPTVGQRGIMETVSEIRFEVRVLRSLVHHVLDAIKRTHPYEEPGIDIYPLLSDSPNTVDEQTFVSPRIAHQVPDASPPIFRMQVAHPTASGVLNEVDTSGASSIGSHSVAPASHLSLGARNGKTQM